MINIDTAHWPYITWKRSPISERTIGGVSLAISIAAGSTFNSFAKTLGTVLSPLSLIFVSELITSFFILFSFGLVPTAKRVLQLKKRDLFPLLAIGLLSGMCGPMLVFGGLQMTSAVNAGLFGRADVIFLMILAHVVLKEKIERAHILAMASVFCGILFVGLRGFNQGFSIQLGDVIVILATLSYASGNIIYRKFLSHVEPHVALLARCSTAIFGFLVLSLFVEHGLVEQIAAFPLALIPALIGFGFISRFLNSVLFYQAIEYVPVMTVTLVSTLDIIGSSLFAYFYLGETLEWYHFAGAFFLILGNVLLALFHTPVSHEQVVTQLKHRA